MSLCLPPSLEEGRGWGMGQICPFALNTQNHTMNFHLPHPQSTVLIILLSITSCKSQEKPIEQTKDDTAIHEVTKTQGPFKDPNPETIITRFVRRMLQDKNGDLWLGTNGDGVIRKRGKELEYFSIQEGFGGVAVRAIVEDENGDLWFGTEGGITRCGIGSTHSKEPPQFTNFTKKDGLIDNDVWSMTIDSKGLFWIGTLQGVSQFDGKTFTDFELPETEIDPTRGVTSPRIAHAILEDSKGQLWFATSGGAYIYAPSTQKEGDVQLSHISEKDGLCNNVVNCILEDQQGRIWFATHHNGVCRWNPASKQADKSSFTHFGKDHDVLGTEVWDLYEDKEGNIWFPVENHGVYRYNWKASNTSGKDAFTNFAKQEGLASNAIQCTYQDPKGHIWLGGWMGLFQYDNGLIHSVGKDGPFWD